MCYEEKKHRLMMPATWKVMIVSSGDDVELNSHKKMLVQKVNYFLIHLLETRK